MSEVLHVMAHDSILFLTQDGIARSIKAYQIPEASRTAAGSAITQARLVCLSSMIPASACNHSHCNQQAQRNNLCHTRLVRLIAADYL